MDALMTATATQPRSRLRTEAAGRIILAERLEELP
jgi:hypothetical protein